MKKALIIIGIIFTSYFVISWVLVNIIAVPLAAWNSHQSWKEVEKENKIILEIGDEKLNTDLIGIYEYKTTEKHENHYIVIDRKKSKLIGFYYGTESGGEHGIFYYGNRIENLKAQGNSIKFDIGERKLYSTTQFRIIKHARDTIQESQGISKSVLKYNGLITENGLKLNCNSEYDDCWDNSMEFIKLIKNNVEQKIDNKYINKLLFENELNSQNKIKEFSKFNFPKIWMKTENHNVFGIIGKDNQRIKIKLISIEKDQNNPQKYIVKGKSNVKDNICDFNGFITLKEVYETKELDYGVDNEYENKGIKSQGILIANYELFENIKQTHSGKFSGKLYSKWYLTSDNKIEYDDISSIADGYTNNIFAGKWENYKTHLIKKCNWGDYRIPDATSDFDIGAAEFSPNLKYYDKGWESRAKIYSDEQAKMKEMEIWWK